MSINEQEGCDILERVFRARGYDVARNVLFAEGSVEFHADGWDAKKRVGFEYLTSEAADHDDLTSDEYAALSAQMLAGALHFFIVDEVEVEDEAELVQAATKFLDEVERKRAR
jgi:hypothetical protein